MGAAVNGDFNAEFRLGMERRSCELRMEGRMGLRRQEDSFLNSPRRRTPLWQISIYCQDITDNYFILLRMRGANSNWHLGILTKLDAASSFR